MAPVPTDRPYTGAVDRCRACGRDFDTSRLTADKLCEGCDASAHAAQEHIVETQGPRNDEPAAAGEAPAE